MYMGRVVLGRLKFIKQSRLCQNLLTLEFEVAIPKLERNESPGINQIPAEVIQAGGKTSF
jgi:hypothetical protein